MDIEEKKANGYHLLSDFGAISEPLKSVFGDSWIETVEQAVGFLCATGIDVEGREDFLARAKDTLGEDVYLKYSTPVEERPLGCKKPTPAVEFVTGDQSPEATSETSQTRPSECPELPGAEPSEENCDETVEK